MSLRRIFGSKLSLSNTDQSSNLLLSTPALRSIEIRFSQRSFILILLKVVLALIVCHFITLADRFVFPNLRFFPNQLFDLNGEANFPAYFSTILLFVAAALLALIAIAASKTGQPFVRHWQGLALIFVGLSIDENLSLHEKTALPLQRLFNASGIFYYAWIIPAIVLVIALLLAYQSFLRSLPPKTRRGIVLAGGLYLSGTIGSEMLSGLWASQNDMHNLVYGLLIAVEEGLEMVGLVLFISVLLSLLRSMSDQLAVRLTRQ